MQQTFQFHSYMEKIDEPNEDMDDDCDYSNLAFEINLGFSQVIPKNFKIDSLNDDSQPFYYLCFYTTVKFNDKKQDCLSFNNFQFELYAAETDNEKQERTIKNNSNLSETSDLSTTFVNFIEKNYLKFFNDLFLKKTFDYYGDHFKIAPQDYEKILNGVKYIQEIFPNERDVVLIQEKNAEFYLENIKNSGLNEGIEVYQKYNIWKQTMLLDEKLPTLSKIKNKNKI